MKKIKGVFSVFLFTLMFLWASNAGGSNYVKIATIGAGSPVLDKSLTPREMVERMVEFWRKELVQVLPDHPDLIVLPEMCDEPRGLGNDEILLYYEARGNQLLHHFASVAKENHCYIAYGTRRLDEEGNWRNSCILLNRQGEITGIYNKNYITFRGAAFGTKAEDKTPIFQTDFGTVGCVICFDLNFDELRQKYASLKPDILLFPSMYHGGLVQGYWAYSCESYFVGATTSPPSEIRNPLGDVVATTTNYFNYAVTTVNLDYKLVHLDQNWDKLRALKKKYGRGVTIYDPGRIGAVMVTSESDSISAKDMVEEFGIELLGDYLTRSCSFR